VPNVGPREFPKDQNRALSLRPGPWITSRGIVNVVRTISPHEQWCKPGKPKQAEQTPVEMVSVSRCICCGWRLRSRSWGCCRLSQSRNSGQSSRQHRRSNWYSHCVFTLYSCRTPNELADGMFLGNGTLTVMYLFCSVNMTLCVRRRRASAQLSRGQESRKPE